MKTPSSIVFLQMATASFNTMKDALDKAEEALKNNKYAEAQTSLDLFNVLVSSTEKSLDKSMLLSEKEQQEAEVAEVTPTPA